MNTSSIFAFFFLTASVTSIVACASPTDDADDEDLDDGTAAAADGEEPVGVTSAALSVGDPGKFNLWDDRNYKDTHISRKSYDSSFKNDGFNDKASSVVNRTGDYWMVYQDVDYGGPRFCVRPYSHIADLGGCPNPYLCLAWNDRISSIKRLASKSSCDGHAILGDPN